MRLANSRLGPTQSVVRFGSHSSRPCSSDLLSAHNVIRQVFLSFSIVFLFFLNKDSKQSGTQSLFPDLLVKGFLPQSFWWISWSEPWRCRPIQKHCFLCMDHFQLCRCRQEHTSFMGVWNCTHVTCILPLFLGSSGATHRKISSSDFAAWKHLIAYGIKTNQTVRTHY